MQRHSAIWFRSTRAGAEVTHRRFPLHKWCDLKENITYHYHKRDKNTQTIMKQKTENQGVRLHNISTIKRDNIDNNYFWERNNNKRFKLFTQVCLIQHG